MPKTKTVDLDFKEAVTITSILRELGHPQGSFGDQHLLTAACISISERTMVPANEIMDSLCAAIERLQEFLDQEAPNQLELAKSQAH